VGYHTEIFVGIDTEVMWPGAVDRSSRAALGRPTAPALQSALNKGS
jgi:hypothetical protein